MSQGRTDQLWLTYKQAAAAGAQVRKRREQGTTIQYWKISEEQTRTDKNSKLVLDAQGKPVKAEVRLGQPRVFLATVFNPEQIDGLDALAKQLVLVIGEGYATAGSLSQTLGLATVAAFDLATKSVLGQGGIAQQVRSVVDDVLQRQQGRGIEEPQRGQRQEQAACRVAKVG
jgi:hypothetical protein